MRLDKVIENNLHTTRKAMKRLFLMKRVWVDGKIEQNPQRNVDSQLHKVLVDGKRLTTQHVYYLLNKPKGVVTAKQDRQIETVVDLIAVKDRRTDLYPVGRLDRDTHGLLLLTDNGQLGYDLLQPGSKVEKTYRAEVNESVGADDIRAFSEGIIFHGGVRCQSAQLTVLTAETSSSTVELTIHEGKFHQVKKMFLARGMKVTDLQRKTMGPLHLPEDLAPGEYRPLMFEELTALKKYFR
ncbi:pseudouridine synthase [Enterococcus florum]|uniref:Pseudouridine synthase n=1 Tax=Enterococcus florum TaxID=2480627 RepID=A0A4P5PEN8_9ENTE|nr:16S rRNA pseudouridine(516) synthase [Enterococcus florum]GCF94102.1 pseudouridine synthase [Enterococcus florum]